MKRDLISIFAMFAKFDELCARFSTKANIASSETHYLIKLQKRARLKYSFLNGQVKLFANAILVDSCRDGKPRQVRPSDSISYQS